MCELLIQDLQNEDVGVIMLKELTDLISVRHNDAMAKVEKLAREPKFGSLRKTRISHIKGKEIDTYFLTSFQAIVVGAKLKNSLLMKVIKRVRELENELIKKIEINNELRELIEQFLPKNEFLKENKNGELKTKSVRGYYRVDKHSEYGKLLTKKYQLQKRMNGLFLEDIKLELEQVEMELNMVKP